MEMLIAKRYVKALLEILEEKKVSSFTKNLERVERAFENEKFRAIMASPEIKKEQKEELVLSLLGQRVDGKLNNFIKTLNIHNRLSLIPEIVNQLQKELQRRANRFEGYIESEVKLEKSEVAKLEKALSKYVNATVVLKQCKGRTDGIKVIIEDLGLEASFSKERVASGMISHILKAL